MGTLRACAKTAEVSAACYVAEGPLSLLTFVLRFLKVLIVLAVWRTVFGDRAEMGGMAVGTVMTYTLIAGVFGEQLAVRTNIDQITWEGTVVTKLLQPLSLPLVLLSEMVGRWAPGFLFVGVPLLVAAPALGIDASPSGPGAAAGFAASLLLALAAGVAIDFLFGALLVRLGVSLWAIGGFREVITAVLSGALIPLALMPWGLGRALEWLPFAATASAPLRIYTGARPEPLLALQAFWALSLWAVTVWSWRAVRERVVGHGG